MQETKRDCMSLEGFATYIRIGIQQRLGDNYKVSVEKVIKNNDTVLQGLIIKEQGMNVCPNIYLQQFYAKYLLGFFSLSEIEEEILKCYHQNKPSKDFPIKQFLEWKEARRRIACRLINYESNQKLLQDVPHLRFLDLAIIPFYSLSEDEMDSATILIHNAHLDCWKVTEEELFAIAKENTPKLFPYELLDMKTILKQMGADYLEDIGYEIPMFVLSNHKKINGAICLLYPDVLKDFSERIGKDLYILPSSLHEVILIPADDDSSMEALSQMVREVNATQVLPEEILSDHVYRYTREMNQITM